MLKYIPWTKAADRAGSLPVAKQHWLSRSALQISLLLGLALLLVPRLSTAPPLWWDEGWTLALARNWAESGHYGQFQSGELVAPGMAAAPTVVLPVALSFRIFGVGPWQGRLPGVIYTVLALWLLYRMTARLYTKKTGLLVLVLAVLVPMAPELHPLLLGRQALGEMPALCFVLMGYLALFKGMETNRTWGSLGAGLCWGLAVLTKAQVIPFLALSMVVVGAVLFQKRNWRLLALCLLPLLMATASLQGWLWFSETRLSAAGAMQGFLATMAIAPTFPSRLMALMMTVLTGLPALVGLAYAARHHLDFSRRGLQRVAIWSLAASWLAWYLFLSVGWVRYLFPSAFLSLIFFAGLLRDATDDFDPEIPSILWWRLRPGRWRGTSRPQKAAALLLLLAVPTSLAVLATSYAQADDSVLDLGQYLRTRLPSDALIETYDPEIMFLTDQRYHYPPDRVHVLLNRRTFSGDRSVEIDYDPLAAGPDYLIAGPYSKLWALYPDDLLARHFRLERQFGPYELYRSAAITSTGAGVAIARDNLH